MFNTIPNNPFPPSSENAGGGGGAPYVLPVASAETLGGIKSGNNLTVNGETGVATVNAVIDGDTYRYDISSSNSGLTIDISLYKNGDLQNTRHVSYADVGSGYNVDDRFVLHYQNADAWQWELVLSVASTEHDAGYYWRWKTNETVPCSTISFVTSSQTVNLSPFLNEINNRVPPAPSTNGTYTLKAVVSNGNVSYKWTT